MNHAVHTLLAAACAATGAAWAQPAASTPTRAEVKAEAAAAHKAGTILSGQESVRRPGQGKN